MSKAEFTRIEILRKSFDLIYKNGYQATSIDEILATTKVTKGAFYYHFKSKQEMGMALISDVMHKELWPAIKKSISTTKDFRKNLYKMLKDLPQNIALYVITLYHGVRNMGKVLGKACYMTFLGEFDNYLHSLK